MRGLRSRPPTCEQIPEALHDELVVNMEFDLHPFVQFEVPQEMHGCMELSPWYRLGCPNVETTVRAAELPAVRSKDDPTPSYPAEPWIAAVLPAAAITAGNDGGAQIGGQIEKAIRRTPTEDHLLPLRDLQKVSERACSGLGQYPPTPESCTTRRWNSFAPLAPGACLI
jgi:hypothetical protein